MPDALYVDASAFVKLFVAEPESAAFTTVAISGAMISSELLAVEALRTARRLGEDATSRARAELRAVHLVPFTEEVREAAVAVEPRNLASLDAIHVATTAALRDDIDALVTYDRRMTAAAEALGIRVLAPA